VEAQLFLSVTLALNFNNRCSALAGAARTTLALSLTFTASGAAVGFWYFFPAWLLHNDTISLDNYFEPEIQFSVVLNLTN
jgi:hypothetical protein